MIAAVLVIGAVVGVLLWNNYQDKEAETEKYNKNVKKCAANMKEIADNLEQYLQYGIDGKGFSESEIKKINIYSDDTFINDYMDGKVPTCPFNKTKYKVNFDFDDDGNVSFKVVCVDEDCPNCKDD